LKVMTAASIGANIGASNLDTTTNGLVIVMKSLHQPASMAMEDMGLLNEIVGAGNLHMEDLVSSLGKVLPQANAFGVSLRSVGSALDVMTSRGINTQMAATRLGMTLNLLGAPKPAAQKAFDTIGLSAHQLAEDLRKPGGILTAVADLKTHLDKTFPAHGGKPLDIEEKRAALATYKKSMEETGVTGAALQKDLEKYASSLAHGGSGLVEQTRVLSQAFGGGRQSATILTLVQNVDDLRKTYERLPEGSKALKRLMDDQSVWEKTSQAQFDHIKASFSTSMTSIGKNIAPIVLPVLGDIAKGVEGITHAFEGLPPGAQHVAEALIALVAVAGPLAGIVSKFAGAALVIDKLKGGGHTGGLGSVPGLPGLPGGGSQIYGWKGPLAPGSLMNPIAVVVAGSGVGGQLVPPGKMTASEAEKVAGQTKGGVLLPPGPASDALAGDALMVGGAGATAAKAGLGAKLLALGKGALGKGLGGLGVGLGGLFAADMAGSIIGGSTGHAVSSIGGMAATGAGIGMLAGPEGAVAGAAVGALIGGLKLALSQPSFGQKLADTLGAGMTPGAHDAIKAVFDAQHNFQEQQAGRGGAVRGVQAVPPRVTISNAQAYAGGAAIAAAIGHKAEAFKLPDLSVITGEVTKYFSMVPARTRVEGAKAIVAWTAGMESQGRLPVGSTDKLIASLLKKWPELAVRLKAFGESSIKELAKTLEAKETADAAKKTVEEVAATFQGLPPKLKAAGGNVQKEWGITLDYLISQTHSKMPQVRDAAVNELKKMHAQTEPVMVAWSTQLVQEFQQAGLKGRGAYKAGIAGLVADIELEEKLGLISVKKGNRLIVEAEQTAAEEIAGKEGKLTGKNVNEATNPTPHHATGGRVPGSGLHDTVPILGRRGGVRGIVAPGELLIANRHTEARVNRMLAAWNTSLGHEVAGEGRPHSAPMFAKGGYAGYSLPLPRSAMMPGSWSIDKGVDIPAGANTPEFAIGPGTIIGEGIQGFGPNAPILMIDQGPLAGKPVYYGHAGPARVKVGAHVSAGQQIAEVGEGIVGISTGPHIEIGFGPPFGSGTGMAQVLKELLAGAGVSGTAGGAATPHISAPHWKGPGGLIGKIGRTALARTTRAANARLTRLAAQAGGIGAAGVTGTAGASIGHLVPGIMAIEQQAAALAGLAWNAPVVGELLTKESAGGINEPPSGSLSATGPNQVIPGTFASYAMPGHGNINNPLDNAIASMRYIRATYKSLAGMAAATGLFGAGYHGYSHGGRMNFAGAFAGGGAVTASSPTLAMFGEHGTETALFLPHAATGAEILEGIGEPMGSKPARASKPRRAYNPATDQIETHTPEEWSLIHAEYAKFKHDHPKLAAARSKKAKVPTVEDAVTVGGLPAGAITEKGTAAGIDIPGDIGKLSVTTWKKVIAAITKTIADTSTGAGLATSLADKLARDATPVHHHAASARAKELATRSIQGAAKTVVSVLKAAPEEEGVKAGDTALGQLDRLMKDAKLSANKGLLAGLRKSVETTLKTTATRIVKQSEAVPPGDVGGASSTALSQLASLIRKASGEGAKGIELELFKDMHKVLKGWTSAISSALSKATGAAGTRADLRAANANLALVEKAGKEPLGSRKAPALLSKATDPVYLREEQAAEAKALSELVAQQATFSAILKKLHAAEARARKRHETVKVRELRREIHEVEADSAEVDSAIEQNLIDTATQRAEYQKAVQEAEKAAAEAFYENLKKSIAEADEVFQSHLTTIANQEVLSEGALHREGKDFSGLEELKGKQEGVLTPAQIAQAKSDLAKFVQGHNEQIAEDQRQKAYDESQLGGLTGQDKINMEKAIEALGININSLLNGIYDQTKATEKLTEATNTATKTYGGTVGFNFKGNDYVVGGGQSSSSGADVMVGV
jgi:murein DD-endopeptidase MepM/ murein hydrolase activator NlpD